MHLVGLRAGEASCQRSAASRHRGRERGAAVGQEGLQVAAQLLRTSHRCVTRQQKTSSYSTATVRPDSLGKRALWCSKV